VDQKGLGQVTNTQHLTQKQYALLRGCAPSAVTKAVKEGRITLVLVHGKKMVDVALADRQWAQNTRARGDSHSAMPKHVPDVRKMVDAQAPDHSEHTLDMVPPPLPAEPDEAMTYDVARRRREAAEARIAEMKQAEMEGVLIRVDSVRSSMATKISGARDALLQIPSRMASILAAETDPVTVQNTLHDEIHQALVMLATAPNGLGKEGASA
jgi:hypothetical protein